MSPYSSGHCRAAGPWQWSIRDILRAASKFRRSEQPEIYAHVHPHGHATAKLSRAFAAALMRRRAAAAHALDEIELGAYLHDIGKYLIPESVLLKPGPLSAEERAAVSLHPAYGAAIIAGLSGVTDAVCRAVLYHHERWDGDGYPGGLKGARIPFAARLVAVCDVYTSLRARRPYKPALSRREAAAEMEAMAGRELDPDMARDFFRLIIAERRGRAGG
jgi:HD-GYP domain-containing protein (c-di-GMP phosphodiesterase class II)